MGKALVPGGAYQSADGSWHDANGKPIDAPLDVKSEGKKPKAEGKTEAKEEKATS
jgi:hypothetical protein